MSQDLVPEIAYESVNVKYTLLFSGILTRRLISVPSVTSQYLLLSLTIISAHHYCTTDDSRQTFQANNRVPVWKKPPRVYRSSRLVGC